MFFAMWGTPESLSLSGAYSMTVDSLEIKAGRFESALESNGEMFEKAEMAKNVCRDIPRKPGFDLQDLRGNDEFCLVMVNLTAGPWDDTTQRALRTVRNFHPDRCADVRVKQTVVRAGVEDRFETLAGGMIVDDLNRKYRAPNQGLLWDTRITEGK